MILTIMNESIGKRDNHGDNDDQEHDHDKRIHKHHKHKKNKTKHKDKYYEPSDQNRKYKCDEEEGNQSKRSKRASDSHRQDLEERQTGEDMKCYEEHQQDPLKKKRKKHKERSTSSHEEKKETKKSSDKSSLYREEKSRDNSKSSEDQRHENFDFDFSAHKTSLNRIFFRDQDVLPKGSKEYEDFWVFLEKYMVFQRKKASSSQQDQKPAFDKGV